MGQTKIDGLEALQKKLAKCQDLTPIKKVVQLNGAELQGKAQDNAPVDTGNLKRSIDLNIIVGGMAARCDARAEYAAYVEYGTRFMDAQPYMKPAFDDQKEQFKKDLERIVK